MAGDAHLRERADGTVEVLDSRDNVLATIPGFGGVQNPVPIVVGAATGFVNPMTTSGDTIYGGASGVATRLAKGTDTNVLTQASGKPSWAAPAAPTLAQLEALFTATGQILQGTGSGTGGLVLPPGYEVGYDQITTPVTVSSTTETAGTSIISCAAHTFDGSPVVLEVFFPYVTMNTNGAAIVNFNLFESSTNLGRVAQAGIGAVPSGASNNGEPISMNAYGRLRFSPSAGAHTYVITAFSSSGATNVAGAGAGGTGAAVPAFARFTKV